jgi:MFS family permease
MTSMIVLVAAYSLAGHVASDILTVYAYRGLKLTPAQLGLALGAEGLAAVAGSLVAARAVTVLGIGPTLAWAGALTGAAIAALPSAQFLPAFPVLAALLAIVGGANTIHDINQLTLRQQLTPDHLHGRMNATFRTVYWGAQPLGSFVGGWLGSRIGLPVTILIGGVFCALFSIMVLATPLAGVKTAGEVPG